MAKEIKKTTVSAENAEKLAATIKDAIANHDKRIAEINTELDSLIAKFNESAEFHENKKMDEYLEEAAKLCKEYSGIAEAKLFAEAKLAADPMKFLIEKRVYVAKTAVKVVDNETNTTSMVCRDVNRAVDPLRLHKKIKGGIGHATDWPVMVGRLRCVMIADGAIRYKLDPKKVYDAIAVSEAVAKLKFQSETKGHEAGMEFLRETLQEVVTSMIGPGYTAEDRHVEQLRDMISVVKNGALPTVYREDGAFRKAFVTTMYYIMTGIDLQQSYKQKEVQ